MVRGVRLSVCQRDLSGDPRSARSHSIPQTYRTGSTGTLRSGGRCYIFWKFKAIRSTPARSWLWWGPHDFCRACLLRLPKILERYLNKTAFEVYIVLFTVIYACIALSAAVEFELSLSSHCQARNFQLNEGRQNSP